jgi:hypothetical protein
MTPRTAGSLVTSRIARPAGFRSCGARYSCATGRDRLTVNPFTNPDSFKSVLGIRIGVCELPDLFVAVVSLCQLKKDKPTGADMKLTTIESAL